MTPNDILIVAFSTNVAIASSVSSSAKRFLSANPSVEKEFSTHLVTRSLTIFGHSRVMPAEQGYELRTMYTRQVNSTLRAF